MNGKSLYCVHVRDDMTILYFSDETCKLKHRAPLAYEPLEVDMYAGSVYVGTLVRGRVWCTCWKYKVAFGRLIVVCQLEE